MDNQEFRKLVEEALNLLPQEFAEKLDNVAVVVEDLPSKYQLKKSRINKQSLLLGLYEGVPLTSRGIYYSSIPDKITIFKNAILLICKTEDDIKQQVRKTVIHEIGHHFGLLDSDMK